MYKLLIVLFILTQSILFGQNVVINEIMASNQSTLYDDDGDAPDWIELYNTGAEAVDLSGFGLSDDTLETQKWVFNDTSVAPGAYLIIFASDKDRQTEYLHTNFKISASGESITLSDTGGFIIDQVDVPEICTDISYARQTDGSFPWVFQTPTPGSANTGDVFEGFADTIAVSLPSGFYSSGITVELTAGDSRIFYTLDGSDPDSTCTEYTTPINIEATSVLKAVSLKTNYLSGPTIYRTYFINEDTDLPVVSLITDPYNLFDYNYGIYVDGPGWTPNPPHRGANYWMDWERPAHVEFFDDDKNQGFSENCGIAIYGAWTRSYEQKSFSVKFKDSYNADAIEYPLFPGFDVTTFKSFVLRNSGNDFYYTHIRDAMMQTLIEDLDIDYLEYRPAVTFINGEYWGIYNIREKISEHYIAYRHGVDPDNIDMLEDSMKVIHGDSLHYKQLIDYVSSQNMTTDEAYNYVTEMIDLDECLLYFAAQVYYNNQDWPANNIKYWRERSENSKWRWILYDLDFGFNLYENTGQSENHLYYLLSGIETRPGSNPPWSTLLPRKLVENPRIKNQFINLIADLLNTNFKSDRVIGIMNDMADHISGEIASHQTKFGIGGENLNRMTTFAQQRPNYVRGFVRDFFDAGNDGNITLNSSEGGRIKLNSLYFEPDDLPWTGVYFQNNEVQLKAIPDNGYKFDGWSGATTSGDAVISLSVGSSANILASFSPDSGMAKQIVINEINYNASAQFDSGDWIEIYNGSSQAVDISQWIFSDSDPAHQFIIPDGTTLEPDQYLVLIEDEDLFTSCFPEVTNYLGETGFGLSGSGEFIVIYDEEDQFIDSLTYDDNAPWPTAPDGSGPTLELLNPALDNSKGENWAASGGNGSPGTINTVFTSVQESPDQNIPEIFGLYQNYPNPFNSVTHIRYSIAEKGLITLKIYNMLGQEIAILYNGIQQAGNYTARFDAIGLVSGVYIYRLQSEKVD
ncbi:MAG: CotH kinase family protein, partial [Calditrichaceae bacterium]